jgi:arginase
LIPRWILPICSAAVSIPKKRIDPCHCRVVGTRTLISTWHHGVRQPGLHHPAGARLPVPKAVVLQQLHSALAIISEHGPARITTVGGECSVSMAPFSYLINKHGDDLAILWIDSHPDMGTGETAYPGFHAMVVSALTGHGDQELLEILPATTTADRVALVGMHDWTDPTLPAIAEEWGLSVFSPEALRSTSAPLLDWLGDTGATKVAIHFDVDTIDADEIQLGLGADLGGLTTAEACRVVADIDSAAEVVALTIAEFIPRQVMHLQQILAGFPLLGPRA